MNAEVHTFKDITVNDRVSFSKSWSDKDIAMFVTLSGDANPLHTDEVYAAQTSFGKPIVHGMLVASSFSALVGMYIPGKYCLYVKQDISFKKPVYVGDVLTVEGVVTRKIESTRMLEIVMTIACDKEVVVEGVALVQVQKYE